MLTLIIGVLLLAAALTALRIDNYYSLAYIQRVTYKTHWTYVLIVFILYAVILFILVWILFKLDYSLL